MLERARDFRADVDARRSVRDFSTDPVPRAVIDECLRAAGCAPSGAHQQPWRFVVVTDPSLKIEIRKAVEKLFEVKVVAVNTLRMRGKWRRRGYTTGTTKPWKKAMITLAEGHTIDAF